MDHRVITGAGMFPLKKHDLVVIKHAYRTLKGVDSPYYTVSYIGYGGKKPREENKAPIYIEDVVAVIRPGWRLSSYVSADSIEDAIREAWKNRKEEDE
jgi:hypothetical protein